MNCNEVQNNLPEYCEEALSADRMEAMAAHLSKCGTCAAEESAHRKTWDLLDNWMEVEPDSMYRARFWQKERETGRGFLQSLAPAVRSVLAVAVCSILMIVAAVILVPSHDRSESLSSSSYRAWKPIEYSAYSQAVDYRLAWQREDSKMLAGVHSIISVPDYLGETSESESSIYPDIPLGDKGESIMEGTQRIITEMAEGAL
jgi:hypothetical protein